jgi:hypothetical protein
MARRAVKEQILQDVGAWQADGVISDATAQVIRERCAVPGFGVGQILRYLGIIGLIFLASGILGMIAAVAASALFAGFMLCSVGAASMAGALWLARDRLGRYAWSSRVAMVIAVLCATGGFGLLLSGLQVDEKTIPLVLGVGLLPPIFVLAYRYSITFLLVLGLLGLFHWVGSWSSMFGRASYGLEIQDPKLMAGVSFAVLLFGLWHERALPRRDNRFDVAYQAVALLYLNTSLLILSIDSIWRANGGVSTAFLWVLVLTGASLAELVVGARLNNGRLLGFGVTFLFINGFTRYSEHFWDDSKKGSFFLVGGLLVFAAGAGLEFLFRRLTPPPPAAGAPAHRAAS